MNVSTMNWDFYFQILYDLSYVCFLFECLHQGSERNGNSIPSLSCTYGRLDNKVDFDYHARKQADNAGKNIGVK